MSKVKNPRQKKRLRLTKDHRTLSWEGNKSFRSGWPQKKAKANRKFRHAAKIALAGLDETGEASAAVNAKPKRALYKTDVHPLAQTISIKSGGARVRWGTQPYMQGKKALQKHRSAKAKSKTRLDV